MTDNPRDEVTLIKGSSVGVSGSASDVQVSELDFVKIREVAERFLSIDNPPSSPGEVHLARDVVALSERLVGLSADVSRLTSEKNEWMSKWERERVERENAEAAWVEDVKRLGGLLAEERARVAVLREALEFYADPKTWTGEFGSGGAVARDALASLRDAGEPKP